MFDNNLVGCIHSWTWDISSGLFYVNIFQNHLDGALTSNKVSVLDVSFNKLSGGMNTPLQDGIMLKEFHFRSMGDDGTQYSKSYRISLELMTKGEDLYYHYNISTLTYIDLSNMLSGHVLIESGMLKGLMFLNLLMNQRSGPIPLSLVNLT
eukprot:Gb_19548 [translate_table: standard]